MNKKNFARFNPIDYGDNLLSQYFELICRILNMSYWTSMKILSPKYQYHGFFVESFNIFQNVFENIEPLQKYFENLEILPNLSEKILSKKYIFRRLPLYRK